MTDFVHLHVHSDYSLLDAAAPVMGLADKAEKQGMKALALTDHGNMFGTMEFLEACRKTSVDYIDEKGIQQKRMDDRANPVKPIIGCEVYVAPFSRFDRKGIENENRYHHLVLLASNREGYFNLVKLCSYAYTEGFYYKPRIDEELLGKYHGGLIALSACVSGEIPSLIQSGKMEEAAARARYYRDLFGSDEKGNPNYYLEIQDHGIPAEVLECPFSQGQINDAIAGIARQTGIPLVATNDVHYLDRDDHIAHDILLCIGTAKVRSDPKRTKKYYGDQFYLKSGDEMAALFPDYPEAIANTVRIAGRCVADIPKMDMKDLPGCLPDFEIPSGFDNADAYLRSLAQDGLVRRYPEERAAGGERWRTIQERFDYELGVIFKMGFTGYFLIVADFINWAKEHGIPVGPGRGSGAGSIVAYSLRITNIDPLKYKLVFERFLNPERISMPDFDIDFANDGRDEVIRYVTEKYGRERVGQIIAFSTLGAKQVTRDVARTLGISIPESDMIAKLIPKDAKISLARAIEVEPRLKELEQNPGYTELFALAKKLEGLHRQTSIHPAGVVIGKTPLIDFVPLFRDPKTGGVVTQYSMNFLENCGLIKMDFLGLKTLDVIKHTEELIHLRGGAFSNFNIEDASETDETTFQMLGEGKSYAIFQFESEGMQDVLKRAKPASIEDLIALNSLYRPGPMDNIGQFIESKNGRQAIVYPDPSLEQVLKETYGVIVYQEQVMRVAQIIAGYSPGQADLLRRAMGKKKKEILDKEKIPFLEGAARQGYSPARAGEIYDILVPFADYGFNKSHAAAYSVLAYQTAFLKANFPAEFMAANLTNEIRAADKDKLSECIAEARKMGLVIDPPDINNSQKLFSVVDGRIVYGFWGIKGLGGGPSDEIVNCRTDAATGMSSGYKDFMDFLNRVDIKAVGKGVIERLIQTGAFDRFGMARETLFGNLERAVEYAQNIKDDKKYGQVSLFGDTGEKEFPDFVFEPFPPRSNSDKLQAEKELIGFYFSGHPLDEYRELWQRLVKADLGRHETLIPGSQILVGIVKGIRPITTARGDRMAFSSLEDYNGEIDLSFRPEAWERCKDKVGPDKPAVLKGILEYRADKDKYNFSVEESLGTDEAARAAKEIEVQERKWDKFRNIWKYAKELDLRFPDLASSSKIEPGAYTVIGVIKAIRTNLDKNGKEMAFGNLADNRGEIELRFFWRTWENCKALVALDEVLALKGTIEPPRSSDKGKQVLVVSSVQDINKLLRAAAKKDAEGKKAAEKSPLGMNAGTMISSGTKTADADADALSKAIYREIHIRLRDAGDETALCTLRDFLSENPGACPVFIHLPSLSRGKVIRVSERFYAAVSVSIDELNKCSAVANAWGKI